MKHRLAQKMKKCLFFLYTFIKYKWALAYELPTDTGANSCPVCLGGNEKCGVHQLFLGPAMSETPSLHHFLFENVFKWTKSQVLKSWERDSTWSHRDVCLHSTITQLPCFAKGEIIGYKAANGGRERSETLMTQCWRKKQHSPDVWFHQFQQERWNQHC